MAPSNELDAASSERRIVLEGATPAIAIEVSPELTQEENQWLAWAKTIEITDEASYTDAMEKLAGAKLLIKKWGGVYDPHIKAADKSHSDLIAAKREHTGPLEQFERTIKTKASTWFAADQKRRRDEEAEARREATVIADDKRLDVAAALEKEGNATGDQNLVEHANRIINMPSSTPAIMPARTEVPNLAGISHTSRKRARLITGIDPHEAKMRVIRFVATHPEWSHLLDINSGEVDKSAKQMENRFPVDGFEVWDDFGVTVNTSRMPSRGRS